MASEIQAIRAREVLDSRGNPTVEVEIKTDKGLSRAMVPSGASTGIHEALELRDGGNRFLGKGVQKAVGNVNDKISKELTGRDCTKQQDIDNAMLELDGTENKSTLGANAILGVSMAVCRASALELGIPLYERVAGLSDNKNLVLPTPAMNVINGGEHAGNSLDIQEYMILPVGAKSFGEAARLCAEVYQTLKGIIKEKYGNDAINVGDEGGFAPPLSQAEEPFELILKAIGEAGYEKEIKLGIDAAASEFYNDGKYKIEGKYLSAEELIEFYNNLIETYPIISVEDVCAQDDWDSWVEFTKKFGDKTQVVGDDLLVTNVKRIDKAIESKACNALLLKINQIGTITESIDAARLSKDNGWNVMVSHRSGETEDSFIADLVVGLGTGQIKSGAPCRSERNAKYNQLLRIEEELSDKAKYQGGI
ncbi:MAG: phosphopyruvate hydratase [Candidatus Altiarchaeales archaeon]|nr:phosphopyruvate hydratase [Candidatus Altiarchaeota archaeon]MBU4342348.1 phosphopyruvate hydratase [Candidatus Altiarchaeota archaeon]MBU4406859.1 phosphopyruvate hydratase [Candidatus Altiarchaeota archaeon]MBU4437082.1 phosphopyruvate hydratase [Candidatus Altiarchaeota archaeon]MCG2783032.1 phosphopyruvate hydratase [Candidatus Altiarchaeales archaeon]